MLQEVLLWGISSLPVPLMVNSGADDLFFDKKLARRAELPLVAQAEPQTVQDLNDLILTHATNHTAFYSCRLCSSYARLSLAHHSQPLNCLVHSVPLTVPALRSSSRTLGVVHSSTYSRSFSECSKSTTTSERFLPRPSRFLRIVPTTAPLTYCPGLCW